MNSTLFENTLPPDTISLVKFFQHNQPTFLQSFYLSGGTGLSLQLGHRESEDLDFFSEKPFRTELLEKELAQIGTLSETELEKGTLNTFLNSVKLQFLEYPYPLLEPLVNWGDIYVSSILDIACTKLQTVSMRGSKKDFIDIYFLLQKYTLQELLLATKKKYISSDYNQTHILKSLVYFADAEDQPMPRLHKRVQWDELKKKIILEVKGIPVSV